jgi:hypothetical protein
MGFIDLHKLHIEKRLAIFGGQASVHHAKILAGNRKTQTTISRPGWLVSLSGTETCFRAHIDIVTY